MVQMKTGSNIGGGGGVYIYIFIFSQELKAENVNLDTSITKQNRNILGSFPS